MEEAKIKLSLFSPRRGIEEIYILLFKGNTFEFSLGPKKAICNKIENRDPVWSGESIEDIFKNEHIYQPTIIQRLFEYLWLSWQEGTLDDLQLNEEAQLLAEWLNIISRNKPKSDFWLGFF